MKSIVGIELSHQRAPLAIREKISLSTDMQLDALKELKAQMPEVFILGTCNRLAVYAYAENAQYIRSFFNRFGDLDPYINVMEHDCMAIRHLFATASGLESQALGEHEILGQIKKAYTLAQEAGTAGPVMDEFIRRAIFVGKKVRKQTAIGQYPVSLASVAYDLLRKKHKSLKNLNILVLGTGEMSTLMLKILGKENVNQLFIASRTYDRAYTLAKMYNAQALEMETIRAVLPQVDIVIGATHATQSVLSKADFSEVKKEATLIDLGLPRNFNEDIKGLENVNLFDLDDIKELTYEGMQKRRSEVPKAYDIVDFELGEFKYWLNTRKISPIISSYYEKVVQIQEEELKWALPKMGELDENQRKIVEQLISRVARKLSGKPIEMLKHFSQKPDMEKSPVDTFKELFDL